MTLTQTKKVEKEILGRLKYLSPSKQKEIADFAGYLVAREEWDATFEVSQDTALLMKVKAGLRDIESGDVEKVVL